MPHADRHGYTDLYGNDCQRLCLPAGDTTLRYDAVVTVPDATEDVDLDAAEVPAAQLPDDVLVYTLPSRYCLPDVLGDEAWRLFGGEPGYRRVQAINDHVHGHLQFGYGSSTPTTTAAEAYAAGSGVCRDFAHVAISFCRALSIPARYVFGYLPKWMSRQTLHRWTSPPGRRSTSTAGGGPSTRNNGPQGPGADRAGSRRGRCRDGHHLRRPAAAEHAGLGRGDTMTQVTGSFPDAPLRLPSRQELQEAGKVTYVLHQRFRYTYDAPVRDLNHRLVVVPPQQHGDQRRRRYSITVHDADARATQRQDATGNTVTRYRVRVVLTGRVCSQGDRRARRGDLRRAPAGSRTHRPAAAPADPADGRRQRDPRAGGSDDRRGQAGHRRAVLRVRTRGDQIRARGDFHRHHRRRGARRCSRCARTPPTS